MPDVHARLGASGAKRWMSCPPSVKLEEKFPDRSSIFAEEGTFAHTLAELILRYNNGEMTKRTFATRLNKLKTNEYYSQEMQDYIEDYTRQIWETVNEMKASCPDIQVLFEQRLDFSEYVPEGFGTGDVVIIADDTVNIIDLKYGKGVGVSAENNPQLRLYGIGAYLEHSLLYDINKVKMTIIQPRLENVSVEELTAVELLDWAEKEVKPRAILAMAGEGEFSVGDHCRFCSASATCRARADYNMELAKEEFFEMKGDLLDDNEVGEILRRADDLAAWIKDITTYAYDEAMKNGKKWDGWKLVEGRSNRKYTDEWDATSKLLAAGFKLESIQKPREILGITAMEKVLGKNKFAELLKDLVIKPEGKPVLVKESDSRPELNTAESAKEDFEDEHQEAY